MRIIQITPGTGDFYCGACLRDHALVKALRALGHDALLVPLYLPVVSDESDGRGEAEIFFGGLNVFLQQKLALFRHTPRWVDRLFDARPLLRRLSRLSSMSRASDLGELTVSMLRGEDGHQAKELSRLIVWLKSQPSPDVVCLSDALLAGFARRIKGELRVPIVCTLQGEDCFLDELPEPYRAQAWATLRERAADADHFVAVSNYFADVMCDRLGLSAERVSVVHNGIALDGFAPATVSPSPPVLGYLAFMSQIKGLATLVEAFILLRKRGRVGGLKLRAAGSTTPSSEKFLQTLRARLDAEGLGSDAEFLPNLERREKLEFLRGLTIFSVPATYGEPFGLYLLEAMASGVPAVQPRHAAYPEILEATGGGVLCAPNDPTSLADEIEKLLLDPARARAMGERGRAAVREKFSVETMAQNIEAVLQRVVRKETHALRV